MLFSQSYKLIKTMETFERGFIGTVKKRSGWQEGSLAWPRRPGKRGNRILG